MLSRLILVVLALVAVALYVRVILPPDKWPSPDVAQVAVPEENETQTEAASSPPESVAKTDRSAPATEGTAAPVSTASANEEQTLEPLPAEQMKLVIETLAPELLSKKQ